MGKSRLEWKVGLFVFIGLVLLAILLLEFSKGFTFFQPTYTIRLRSTNVGGLKPRAGVLMSGVQIGTVSEIRLAPDGKTVTIYLKIFSQYEIRRDATFVIAQSGFLGDVYVGIEPTENKAPAFQNGDLAEAQPPFDLQQFTRTAAGFISRIDETVKNLNDALAEVTRVVLNPQTLTNLAVTAANLRSASDRALQTLDKVNAVVDTNAPGLSVSVTNLAAFSEKMSRLGDGLNELVSTNSPEVRLALKNLESSTEKLNSLLDDVQSGKGLAGELLKNPELAGSVTQIVHNLSITSSNLNRLGLWGVLWKHKPARTNAPTEAHPLLSPKNAKE